MYYSTKTYGTDRGLSCVFRQWKADHSHCSFLHGYSLGFKFIWGSPTLDDKNWCFDFGGMKPIKEWLDKMFDHTVLVAYGDPQIEMYQKLEEAGLAKIRYVQATGCEATAKLVYTMANCFLAAMKNGEHVRYPMNPDVFLKSVEVFEHGANSAIYERDVSED